MLNLPENFETFSEARKNGFMKIMEMKREAGKNVVGVFCSYTPVELITAADAIYVGLCSSSEDGIAEAEKHLPKNLCPLIKSSYGLALSDSCPYFYFSDMIIGETTCDGKKKMYELMGKLKHTHVMMLPHNQSLPMAEEMWLSEMYRLKDALEEAFGVTITEEKLRAAIHQKNLERQAMVRLYEIGKLKPCPVSGYELSTIVQSTAFMFTGQQKLDAMQDKEKQLLEAYEKDFKGKPSPPRILITGCPFEGVSEKIVKELEEQGASVVAFENCSGPRTLKDMVDETIDPYRALAKRYLGISCSVMSPNPNRYAALDEMIQENQIDGVVEIILSFCHTFAAESYSVREFIKEKHHIPVLSLTTDYSQSDTGQISTRIGAFLEML